jgi:hypothetical protein
MIIRIGEKAITVASQHRSDHRSKPTVNGERMYSVKKNSV